MIVVDVEIKKAILGRNEQPLEGIEYCGGWRDFANMGVACVCTYDTRNNLSRVFLEEDLEDLPNYLTGQGTAGFNTRRFDLLLLGQHGIEVPGLHYDILEQIWLALGLDPDHFEPKTHGGWSLDAVCEATLRATKSGHGALAPVWWQRGQRGRVIDYCLRDVWLEGQLLKHIIEHREVRRHDRRLELEVPAVVLEACR